ncbi:MAG: ParA family protein [Planctomycetaceae bacterium]|nr:ParA family protein [Planctomycetaceae bacterium]
MIRRIAWLNEKGGSGKSTSALNLSANLATRFGQRVLLVDVDPQANITQVLSQGEREGTTLTDVFLNEAPPREAIRQTEYASLDLLPADANLAEVNVAMADSTSRLGIGREIRLKRALASVEKNYDFVILDTAPQRSLLSINVLNYADEVFVPLDPGFWSIMGAQRLEQLVEQIRDLMEHPTLQISGILLTKVQQTNVARDVEINVRDYFGRRVFKTTIPLNVKVEEAHSRGRSVLDYAPASAGAQAYLEFTKEVLGYGA